MKRIYLSGPMTGLPEFNYPRFNTVATQLRDEGHTVYNPAEFEHNCDEFPIRAAFLEYTEYLCRYATSIYMLNGWKHSKGANAEHALAVVLGLEIIHEYDSLETV